MVSEGLDPATTPARYYLAYTAEVDEQDRVTAGGEPDIEVLGDGG